MGIANSVSMAFSEEEPSANQGQLWRDGEESRTDSNETKEEEEKEKEEEEEEGECIVCKHIKRGECKESFIALQKCVDESEDKTQCKELRAIFKTCMYENPVYHEPLIRGHAHDIAMELRDKQAEKEAAIAKAVNKLRAEKEAVLAGDAAAIAKAVSKLPGGEPPVSPVEVAAIAKAFQDLEAGDE